MGTSASVGGTGTILLGNDIRIALKVPVIARSQNVTDKQVASRRSNPFAIVNGLLRRDT